MTIGIWRPGIWRPKHYHAIIDDDDACLWSMSQMDIRDGEHQYLHFLSSKGKALAEIADQHKYHPNLRYIAITMEGWHGTHYRVKP